MKHQYPFPVRQASSEDVLEILRDNLGHFNRINFEHEPWLTLDFDTSLTEWADEYELETGANELGRNINEFFGVDIGQDDWKRALDPVKTSTLRGLCETVARHLYLPAAEPQGYLGASCREAGAFFTLRALLNRAGVQVAGLRPSTPLSTVALDHFNEILDSTARMAPGLLPSPVRASSKPRLDAAYLAMEKIGGSTGLFGLLPVGLIWISAGSLVMLGSLFGWFDIHAFTESVAGNVWVQIVVFVVSGVSIGGFMAAHLRARIPLESVTFEGFETFGDLARAVAVYEPPTSSE